MDEVRDTVQYDPEQVLNGLLGLVRRRYQGDTMIAYTETLIRMEQARKAHSRLVRLARAVKNSEEVPAELRTMASKALDYVAPIADPKVGNP